MDPREVPVTILLLVTNLIRSLFSLLIWKIVKVRPAPFCNCGIVSRYLKLF